LFQTLIPPSFPAQAAEKNPALRQSIPASRYSILRKNVKAKWRNSWVRGWNLDPQLAPMREFSNQANNGIVGA
jgi:hypothetical protein